MDEIEGLAARVRLALTQTGLFVSATALSPKSESVYLDVSVERGGDRLAAIRVANHPPKTDKRIWRHLAPGDNWARLVIELAKRARLAPPAYVFKEDEQWKSRQARRPSSRERPPPNR